jgi:hypothetical protein
MGGFEMRSISIFTLVICTALITIANPLFSQTIIRDLSDPDNEFYLDMEDHIPCIQSSDSVQPGWPQYTGNMGMSAALLADFDTTYPGLEVIVSCSAVAGGFHTEIFIWHEDGTPMANWSPLNLSQMAYMGSPPAVCDLNNDNSLEMIIAVEKEDGGEPAKVYVLNTQGTVLNGWPNNMGNTMTCPPVVFDLDNDDTLEILAASKDSTFYVWRYDGSNFNSAWPKSLPNIMYDAPAVGNLDADPEAEIVVGTGGSYTNYAFVWNIDGTDLNPNWPKTLDQGFRAEAPALADIDGDGEWEIVMGTGYDIYTGRVYAWEADGSLVSAQWPQTVNGYAFYCPISDLDPSYPGFEIITSVRNDNRVHAWHYDGTPVSGWPFTMSGDGGHSPAIGDIDSDGYLEVITGTYDNYVYAINHDGTVVSGWPELTGYMIQVPATIANIDQDEYIEIVQPSSDEYVHIWESSGTGEMTWPVLQHDNQHTGYYPGIGPGIFEDKTRTFALSALTVFPNPVSRNITIKYNLMQNCTVDISLYDLLGNKIATLLNKTQNKGFNEFSWTINHEFSRDIPSGVYFLVIDTGFSAQSRSITIVR